MPGELEALQTWFFRQLQPGAKRARQAVDARIGGSPTLAPAARLELYADMYLARLFEALEGEYPRLAAALGHGAFHSLAEDYLRRNPSRRPTVQHVGERLPSFLARARRAGKLDRFPFAADLARLEQAVGASFAAEDDREGVLLRSDLAAIAPEAWPSLTFRLTRSLRLLRLGHYFAPSELPLARRSDVRVWRKRHRVLEAPVDSAEWRALRAVRAGKPFGEICLAVGDAGRAATLLATWLDEELLLRP